MASTKRRSPKLVVRTECDEGRRGDQATLNEGNGSSPSLPASPRVSPVKPRRSSRSISRSPSIRAGCSGGSSAIKRSMRLRSCGAKGGVEAPISSRAPSPPPPRGALPARALRALGLLQGSLLCLASLGVDPLEGVVGEEKLASGAVRED